jgi:hypothetical protein
MITNATLTLITRRTAADAGGNELFTPDAAIALRCFDDNLAASENTGGASQRFTIDATTLDADYVSYLFQTDLTGQVVTPPAPGDQITVAPDVGSSSVRRVMRVVPRSLDGGCLDHFEVFSKRI